MHSARQKAKQKLIRRATLRTVDAKSELTWRGRVENTRTARHRDSGHAGDVSRGGHRGDRRIRVRSWRRVLGSPVLLAHLGRVAAPTVLVLDRGQLRRVVGVRVRSTSETSSRHRVQRLSKVSSSLEHHLLGKTFRVAGVSRHQLAQPAEPVVDWRLVESCKDWFIISLRTFADGALNCNIFLFPCWILLNMIYEQGSKRCSSTVRLSIKYSIVVCDILSLDGLLLRRWLRRSQLTVESSSKSRPIKGSAANESSSEAKTLEKHGASKSR